MSLARWRRSHTQAKVEDLRDAVHAVKRSDIIHKINKVVKSQGAVKTPGAGVKMDQRDAVRRKRDSHVFKQEQMQDLRLTLLTRSGVAFNPK